MLFSRVALFAAPGALLLSFAGCSGRAPSVVAPTAAQEDRARVVRVARAQREEEKEKEAGQPFRLPEDEGGQLVGKVLRPSERRGPLHHPQRERNRSLAPHFEPREVSLPRADATVPRLRATAPAHTLRPHLIAEEELSGALDAPVVPQRPSFTTGERMRVRSDDPAIPPPLPIMARPVPDRASLDDATSAASTEAALAAPLPRRRAPAPYQRVTVPDPYENRRPLTLPVPAEGEEPVTGAPVVPKP